MFANLNLIKKTKKETEFRLVLNINKTKQVNKKNHENTFVKEAPERQRIQKFYVHNYVNILTSSPESVL